MHSRDIASWKHTAARVCLGELTTQHIDVCVSSLMIDELWWSLLKLSHRQMTGVELSPRLYKSDRSIWAYSWPRIREITREIFAWQRLTVVNPGPGPATIETAAGILDLNPLAPRDAMHLAIALQHGVGAFVTADRDFRRLRMPATQLTIILV